MYIQTLSHQNVQSIVFQVTLGSHCALIARTLRLSSDMHKQQLVARSRQR